MVAWCDGVGDSAVTGSAPAFSGDPVRRRTVPLSHVPALVALVVFFAAALGLAALIVYDLVK